MSNLIPFTVTTISSKVEDSAYAEVDNKFAYTKGWESVAKTATAAADKFGEKYGPEARTYWLAGFTDKRAGMKKWESFLDTAAATVEADEAPTSDFLTEVETLAAEALEAVNEAELTEESAQVEEVTADTMFGPDGELPEGVIAISTRVELEEPAPAAAPVLTVIDPDDFASIAAQRNWINAKTQSKADVAGARAEVVKRKGNHRAGFNAAKRGEKPADAVIAKYTERHGKEAGWDFANGYAEFNRGDACGTVWAKK